MQPELHINYMAIALAVVASFAFGFLWYGPLFGKKWAAYMGFDMTKPPPKGAMMKGISLGILGSFLMAYVMSHSVQVWRPSVWHVGTDQANYMYGFMAGFFTWIGIQIPMLFNLVGWEMKPWGLFGLHAAYHFINLQIICQILANMH